MSRRAGKQKSRRAIGKKNKGEICIMVQIFENLKIKVFCAKVELIPGRSDEHTAKGRRNVGTNESREKLGK